MNAETTKIQIRSNKKIIKPLLKPILKKTKRRKSKKKIRFSDKIKTVWIPARSKKCI